MLSFIKKFKLTLNFKALSKIKQMTKNRHIQLSISTTWYSFIIGSLMLSLFLITGWIELSIIGLIYILIAGLINGGIFISLFISFVQTEKEHLTFFLYSLLPLINLPIAAIFCGIALNQIL